MSHEVRLWTGPIYDIEELFEDVYDKKVFLRHLRKLSHWPGESLNGGTFVVIDLRCRPVGELRREDVWDVQLDDEIGGRENLRVIVWSDPHATPPTIWVLEVVQKETEEFSQDEVAKIMRRKETVIRTYRGGG